MPGLVANMQEAGRERQPAKQQQAGRERQQAKQKQQPASRERGKGSFILQGTGTLFAKYRQPADKQAGSKAESSCKREKNAK